MNNIKNIILLISYILAFPILLFILILFEVLCLISCVVDRLIFGNKGELDMWKLNKSFDGFLSKMMDKTTGYENID